MAKPQQPELRRSGFTPGLDPDAIASEVETREHPRETGGAGPVPEENRPGHRPDRPQDKPSGDDFVARARTVADDARAPAPELDEADGSTPTRLASGSSPTRTSAPVSDASAPGPQAARGPCGVGTVVRLVGTVATAPVRISMGVVRGLRQQL